MNAVLYPYAFLPNQLEVYPLNFPSWKVWIHQIATPATIKLIAGSQIANAAMRCADFRNDDQAIISEKMQATGHVNVLMQRMTVAGRSMAPGAPTNITENNAGTTLAIPMITTSADDIIR